MSSSGNITTWAKTLAGPEARTKGKELTDAIKELLAAQEPTADSPVYTFIPNLQCPGLAPAAPGPVAAMAATSATPPKADETQSALMALAREAQANGDFATAKNLLTTIVTVAKSQVPARPVDVSILQQLALVTYKSKQPTPLEALHAACAILAELEPETTNDTETLGLWSAVHKRLWDLTGDAKALDQAIRGAERGYYLRNDYYNGINYAFLLNVRAADATELADGVADFVRACRIRREVIDVCEQWLRENPVNDAGEGRVRRNSRRFATGSWQRSRKRISAWRTGKEKKRWLKPSPSPPRTG